MKVASISKLIAWSFLGVCALLLVLVLAAGSNWGLRTAVYFANKTEGLNISGVQGSLYSKVQVNKIDFALEDTLDMSIKRAEVDINLECLLDFAACLHGVHIEKVSLSLAPSKEITDDAPTSPEYIKLPIPVDVIALSVGRFELYQQVRLESGNVERHQQLSFDALQIDAFSGFSEFSIERLSLDKLHLYAQGAVQPAPSSANQEQAETFALQQIKDALSKAPQIAIPEIFIPINATLSQFKLDELCWGIDSKPVPERCVALSANTLALQNQILNANVNAQSPEMYASFGLAVEAAQVQAKLDFAADFAHEVSVNLVQKTGQGSANTLLISSSGDLAELSIEATIIDQQGNTNLLQAKLSGQWEQANFPINLSLNSASLAPLNPFLSAPIDVEAKNIALAIAGNWNAYDLEASTELLAGMSAQTGLSTLKLSANVAPANLSVNIQSLQSDGALGDVQLSGSMKIAPIEESDLLALTSELLASLKSVNIGALYNKTKTTQPEGAMEQAASDQEAGPQSNINGDFKLSHVLTEQWMQGSMRCKDIAGEIAGVELSLVCDIAVNKAGEINIRNIAFRQGSNTINAQGSVSLASTKYMEMDVEQVLASSADLRFNADIVDASRFSSELAGSLNIEGRVLGTISAPQINLVGEAEAVRFANMGLEAASIKLDVDADNNFASTLDLNIAEMAIDSFVINNANIRASGNQAKHQLNIAMQSKDLSLEQSFSGGLSIDKGANKQSEAQVFTWQGQWESGRIALPFTEFMLDDESAIEASFVSGAQTQQNILQLSIADHCWRGAPDNTLCISDVAYQDDQAKARIDVNYDVAAIARHYDAELILPDTRLPLSSMVNIQYDAKEGLFASAFSNIIGGEIETPQHMLELTAIVANLTLDEQVLSSAIFAGTQQTGTLGFQSQLDLQPEQRIHSGRVRIDQFDLSLLERFIPSTQSLLGMVNANIGFDGELTNPQLTGKLSVDSGELIVDAYTYPLTEFNHQMTFDGQRAQMQGDFKLGKGSSTYQAQLDMQDGFNVKGQLEGSNLQFAFQDSTAEVSPNLSFDVSASDLILKGDIAIPQAAIKINELPESAKTPSSDTIIIGKPAPEPVVPLAMDIQLNILIDQEKRKFVTVDALDLQASLAGDLNLSVVQKRSKNSDNFQPMRTTLNGQVSILDGSYEAYGQMLVVQSGKVFFNGEPSLPQFNIRAIRNPLNTEGEVIAGLHITGNPVVPRVELFSDPPMTQAKQLSYLLQGRDLTASSGSGSSSNQTDAALINALVSFGVGRSDNRISQVGRALGFDSLSLQTAGSGNSSQVQISGRIAEDIQITYGIGVFDQASEVILKYQIMPQLFIEAKSGVESAVDLFYQISRGEN